LQERKVVDLMHWKIVVHSHFSQAVVFRACCFSAPLSAGWFGPESITGPNETYLIEQINPAISN